MVKVHLSISIYFPFLQGLGGEEEQNSTIFPDLISFENNNEQIREPAGHASQRQRYPLTCKKPQSWNILQLLWQAEEKKCPKFISEVAFVAL